MRSGSSVGGCFKVVGFRFLGFRLRVFVGFKVQGVFESNRRKVLRFRVFLWKEPEVSWHFGDFGFGFGFTALGCEGFMGCCLEAWLDSNKRLQSHGGLWCSSINAYDVQGGGAW